MNLLKTEVEDVSNDLNTLGSIVDDAVPNHQPVLRNMDKALKTNHLNVVHHHNSDQDSPVLNAMFSSRTKEPVTNSNPNMEDVEGIQEGVHTSANFKTTVVDIEFYEGQVFTDKDTFKLALCEHAIRTRYDLQAMKSDNIAVYWKCRDHNCTWRIRARKENDLETYRVVVYFGKHICSTKRLRCGTPHSQATVKWVCSKFRVNIGSNQDWTPASIVKSIETEYGIKISYKKAYNVKQILDGQSAPLLPIRSVGRPRKRRTES
ncbi:hypothetical protein IFM89_014347 [Coptis chinensis]|uniref:Transposase MuDR plant domain-containing protein n=1 Tax=Coptis chinensis TaxID=261450 RepID=A0A835ISA9_9MAGN|nr:hypothetical protein IFM89_014347 [Coptis chinensis]